MNFTKVIFRPIKRLKFMGVGFRRRSQFHSIYMSREIMGHYTLLIRLTIKIFCIVCFVAVACGLDDVSNNRLRCADVPGIRPPFSYNLILLIKLIKDRITTIHCFVKEDRHFIVLVNFSQIYNLLFMYRLSRSFYFIIKIIAVWCF